MSLAGAFVEREVRNYCTSRGRVATLAAMKKLLLGSPTAAHAAAIAKAIRYSVGVVGAEPVALGPDFDGAVIDPFDSGGLTPITEARFEQGMSEHDIQLVMGANFARLLSQVLPEQRRSSA